MDLLYNYITVFLGVASIILLFFYRKRKTLNYWDTQGVPNIKSSIFRDFVEKAFKPMHELEVDLYKKFGRIYGRYDGPTPVLTVGDPDVLKYILVKDFNVFQNRRNCQLGDPIMDNNLSLVNGEDWKRIRTVVTPTFTSAKLKQMMNKIYTCAKVLMAELNKSSTTKSSANLERLIHSFVMDVIASCAFGIKIVSLEDPKNPFVVNGLNFLTSGFSLRCLLPVYCPWLMRLLGISMFNPTAVDFFRKFTLQIVKERMKSNEVHADFLYLLMKARQNAGSVCDEENNHVSENKKCENLNQFKPDTKFLSENELIAQCVVFFLAGFETTSILILFTLANLAANNEIQEKLWNEIETTLEGKEKADYDDIMSMKYLDAVLSESLRMSSAAIRVDRVAENDYVIAQNGIHIRKGQLISVPIYCMHYDPEWYPDPHKFNPERFTPEAKSQRNPFVYLPFGIGPRSCIGSRFALLEAKLIIIMIIRKFRVTMAPEMKFPLQFDVKQGLLTIISDIYLNIHQRKES